MHNEDAEETRRNPLLRNPGFDLARNFPDFAGLGVDREPGLADAHDGFSSPQHMAILGSRGDALPHCARPPYPATDAIGITR